MAESDEPRDEALGLSDREALSLFRSSFEDSSIGFAVVEVGSDGIERIVKVNDALVSITGVPSQELLGQGATLLGLDRWSRGAESVRATGRASGKVEFEHTFERPDHSRMWVLVTLSPTQVREGSEGRVRLVQVQDISDRREYQSRLQYLAEHDPLTGLVNIRRFYEEIDKGVAYQRRYGGAASLISFDLDRFKLVNDSAGHAAGDEVLRRFATILTDLVRETDVVARLGGDEFAIFLPGTDGEGARAVADEILSHLRDNPIEVDREGIGSVTLSTSGGITQLGGRDDVEAKDLLAEADSALYAAKRAGRNCVVDFTLGNDPHISKSMRLTWAERTRRALDGGGLFLEAQPIKSLSTGSVVRVEALLRMNDPDAGVVYPPTFLYTAERFGLSAEIDEWVVRTVIERLAASPDDSSAVSLNLTAASLDYTCDLPERIPDMLRDAGVEPGRLSIELTEGACVNDIERTRLFVEKMKEIGCRVAIDDFGAGFGGFYYLKMLPIDILKIDGEFIRSMVTSDEDRLIVKAVSDMSRGLDIEVVAEFVTDRETADLCSDLGVDAIQGSFVGPTISLEEALGIS